jgi:ADP-heptose:LPS heptosyltransferase
MLYAFQHHNTSAYICILHLIDDFVKVQLNKSIQILIVNFPRIKNRAGPLYETYSHHSPVIMPDKMRWFTTSMHRSSETRSNNHNTYGVTSSSIELDQSTLPVRESKDDTPRFLITLDKGIGDTLLVGLSAVDQIILNDPMAYGKIDILCTPLQSQIFEYDPRINRVIQTETKFASGSRVTEWLRGIFFDRATAQIIHFLQSRCYEAVLPAIVAPGLYLRLHTHLMYPRVFKLAINLLLQGSPSDMPMRKFIRQMVNKYFCKDIPASKLADEVLLFLDTQHIQKAITLVEDMKQKSSVDPEKARVLLVAADSGSIVTRPPTCLLAPALANVLHKTEQLIIGILPAYTDAMAAKNLELALLPEFAGRVFKVQQESTLTLLDTAALLDQADIFVTGDTGVMHLASATKTVRQDKATSCMPKNSVKIIAIFGGTNPDIWGDNKRTIIVGRGRREQRRFSPGFVKEMYNPKDKNLFDHISPQQLTETINSLL